MLFDGKTDLFVDDIGGHDGGWENPSACQIPSHQIALILRGEKALKCVAILRILRRNIILQSNKHGCNLKWVLKTNVNVDSLTEHPAVCGQGQVGHHSVEHPAPCEYHQD